MRNFRVCKNQTRERLSIGGKAGIFSPIFIMDLGLEKAFRVSLNVSLSDAVGSSKHGRKHSMFIINTRYMFMWDM